MIIESLLPFLGHEIQDAEEERYLLFSQDLPESRNLGFVDSKATELVVPIGKDGHEFTIIQSPTLLSSSISTGTTGAVLWKVTPLFASWASSLDNLFFHTGSLGPSSSVIELGCGISGLTAMAMSLRIGEYICTDQEYVLKHLRRNLEANAPLPSRFKPSSSGKAPKKPKSVHTRASVRSQDDYPYPNTRILTLDWETSAVSSLPSVLGSAISQLDAVIACDCIYNSHLVSPFVQTCAELCRLRQEGDSKPVLCIVAQQLRSDEVFEEWLTAFMRVFRVWQIPNDQLIEGLRPDQGYVVHVGILREIG